MDGLSSREKRRMAEEADFAFKQAYLLCPYLPETNGRYGNFLVQQERLPDAQDFTRSAYELNPSDPYAKELKQYVEQVIAWKKSRR